MAMYKTPCVFEERAQHLEALVPLSEDQIQFQVPTSSGFQLPRTPSPGTLTPFSELPRHLNVYTGMEIK